MADEAQPETRNPVGWFEIYVQDLGRAEKFYEAVMQVKFTDLATPVPGIEMRAFPMNMGGMGASGALVKMEGMSSGGTSVLIYFMCDDCAVTAKRAPGAGGKVFKEKMSIGEYGFIALITDTEGNMVGLHSMK